MSTNESEYSPEQKRIIQEIRRIADDLQVVSLSQDEFDRQHVLGGVTTARQLFGSWNEAVVAAGLVPNPPDGSKRTGYLTDGELLDEIFRLHKLLGKPPTEAKLSAMGKYSLKPYRDRWGTFSKAREIAYELLGTP
jgi:hypothetical protein